MEPPAGRRVNYDRIAPNYDRRFERDERAGVAAALRSLAREVGARRVLEVGCGTGHWLQALEGVGSQRWGLDLSRGMLQQARRGDDGLLLLQGRAEALPFSAGAFDLVYCVNALHHFDASGRFIAAAVRLLRPGGALAVVGSDPHARSREQWYVYHYFDGVWERDLERFPRWGQVLEWMVGSGCREVRWTLAERIVDHKLGRAVLEDPFLKKDATSQLALLSDAAYAAGRARIEAALARAEARGEEIYFPTVLDLGMMVGWVD